MPGLHSAKAWRWTQDFPFTVISPQNWKKNQNDTWHVSQLLTSGLKGGSTSPTSSILKLMFLKKECDCTALPAELWQPSLCFGFLFSSCNQIKWKMECFFQLTSDVSDSPGNRSVSPRRWTLLRIPPGPPGSFSPSPTCWYAPRGLGTVAFRRSFHISGSRGPTSRRSSHNSDG